MFMLLAVLLAVAWIAGFTIMHLSSFAVHLLLVAAVMSLGVHFVRTRRLSGHQ